MKDKPEVPKGYHDNSPVGTLVQLATNPAAREAVVEGVKALRDAVARGYRGMVSFAEDQGGKLCRTSSQGSALHTTLRLAFCSADRQALKEGVDLAVKKAAELNTKLCKTPTNPDGSVPSLIGSAVKSAACAFEPNS